MPQFLPHFIIIFGSSAIILVLAALLLGIRIPADEGLRKLRSARGYLSLSYFILAFFGFMSFFMENGTEDSLISKVLILLIGSYQALLFTMTLLTFIQPQFVRKQFIIRHLSLITAIGAGLFLVLHFYPDTIFHYAFYAAITAYLLQLVYYTRLFGLGYKVCIKQLEDYYDEDEDDRLHWVAVCFYSALGIGILALPCIFSQGWVYSSFVVIYTAYYAYMVSRFYNYRTDARFVIPIITSKADTGSTSEVETPEQSGRVHVPTGKELKFKITLEQWVNDRKFVLSDVSVVEIAAQMDTDLDFLRYYFRTHMQTDFRTWRSELRIREAVALLNDNPELAVERVREITGFKHRANFYRQFQKITGMTPTDYKQKCLRIPEKSS